MSGRNRDFVPGVTLWLVALLSFVPFIAILLTALQPPESSGAGFSIPSRLYLGNFSAAWTQGGLLTLFGSSAFVAMVVVPVGVLCATMGGYALGTMRFHGERAVLVFLLAGLTLPYEAIVIALYYDFRTVHLLDTYWALILPLAGAFVPFGIIWMRSHFEGVPRSMIEAAEIDGAGTWQTFTRVLLPTAWPAISTLALLYFLWSWNQFLFALILIQDPAHRTAPTGLTTFVTQFSKNLPMLSAATILVMIPVVVVYLAFQRNLVNGFLQGAVKE